MHAAELASSKAVTSQTVSLRKPYGSRRCLPRFLGADMAALYHGPFPNEHFPFILKRVLAAEASVSSSSWLSGFTFLIRRIFFGADATLERIVFLCTSDPVPG